MEINKSRVPEYFCFAGIIFLLLLLALQVFYQGPVDPTFGTPPKHTIDGDAYTWIHNRYFNKALSPGWKIGNIYQSDGQITIEMIVPAQVAATGTLAAANCPGQRELIWRSLKPGESIVINLVFDKQVVIRHACKPK